MSNKAITGFKIIRLTEILEQLGEERVESILSSFSSPLNKDVEDFLRFKAITFDKQSISRTHLVFTSYKKKPVLIGYFTLANKEFKIPIKNITKSTKKRIGKFGRYEPDFKIYTISAPLIAQLGKNFCSDYNKLISGDELLQLACDIISDIQLSIGGKIAYIECENKPKLVAFYERNGFKVFSERQLDKHLEHNIEGPVLLQMLKIL